MTLLMLFVSVVVIAGLLHDPVEFMSGVFGLAFAIIIILGLVTSVALIGVAIA